MSNKKREIKNRYNSQISLLLLGLLNSPNIKKKITTQTDALYLDEAFKKTVFSICLCEIVNVVPTTSLISEIIADNEILNSRLRKSNEFNSIFTYAKNTVKCKSSILALSLLNTTFSDSYVLEMLLDIVERLDKHRDNTPELHEVKKSLLRFHFVEKILPQKKKYLNRYYEQLKIKCKWLLSSPHYWVQYAMCRLAYNDFQKAQDYLTTAYEQAKTKKVDFHTDDIDTQQARLFLNQSLNSHDPSESYKLFNYANVLLSKLPNDGKKFRQVLIYRKIFSEQYLNYTPKNKTSFEHSCKALLDDANKALTGNTDNITANNFKTMRFINESEEMLTEILINIKSNRS